MNDNRYLDPTLAVAVRQKNSGPRMYKLKATCDGIGSFDCMEFKRFGHIDSIVPGEKYLIRATQDKPITVRRGCLKLEHFNIQFICGDPAKKPKIFHQEEKKVAPVPYKREEYKKKEISMI